MFEDIQLMHAHYGITKFIKSADIQTKKHYLDFRLGFIKEEYTELVKAYQAKNSNELVDALIDILVVTIGTLDTLGIDIDKAWDDVYKANMSKVIGENKKRTYKMEGLPDLVKPEGWTAPDHSNNTGDLDEIFDT